MAQAEKENMARMNQNELSEIIKELRAKLGLTQEQFAAEVGVTFSTVNRWENGRGTPSPLALRRIKELRKQVGNMKESKGRDLGHISNFSLREQ